MCESLHTPSISQENRNLFGTEKLKIYSSKCSDEYTGMSVSLFDNIYISSSSFTCLRSKHNKTKYKDTRHSVIIENKRQLKKISPDLMISNNENIKR